ncbi:MAG: hypothetical protein HYX79_00620 [Chloroflexi bacterium]|nr:hypothetical protein [Chloroflexota bacterium]
MSKKEKLETRIRNNPRSVSLDDFETLISNYGHIEKGSKHAKARIGNATLTYKRVNPMPLNTWLTCLKLSILFNRR